MAKSLPPVSAKVIADAEQFINEFKRADRQARSSASVIDMEVDKLAKNIKRKFSAGDIGKDVLRGFGLGSGFAVAQTAADMVVRHYEKAAEAAKSIEESTARQLAITRQIIALRQTDDQKLATLESDYAAKARELEAARAPRFVTFKMRGNRDDREERSRTVEIEKTNEEAKAISKLSEELAELWLRLEEVRKKRQEATVSGKNEQAATDLNIRIRSLTEGLRNQEKAFDDLIDAKQRDLDKSKHLADAANQMAERYKALGDPLYDYKKQLTELEQIRGKLTSAEYAAARAAIDRNEEIAKISRVDSALSNFFGDTDKWEKARGTASKYSQEIERIVGRAADGMADAFVDALSGVEDAWSNLGKMIAQEIARVIIQLTVVKPLINGLGSMFASIGFSAIGAAMGSYGASPAGKASGGRADAGFTYRINEDGQEFFKPDVGGTIIPVGASAGFRKAEGGNTYVIDARGTDESVVYRLEQAIMALAGPGVIERRAIGAYMAKRRRGGSDGKAFA